MSYFNENANHSPNASLEGGGFFMDKNLPFMDKTAWKRFLRYAMTIAGNAYIAVAYTSI